MSYACNILKFVAVIFDKKHKCIPIVSMNNKVTE